MMIIGRDEGGRLRMAMHGEGERPMVMATVTMAREYWYLDVAIVNAARVLVMSVNGVELLY